MKPLVVLKFADGGKISAWQRLAISEQFTNPVDTYSFTATPTRAQFLDYVDKLRKGEIVRIAINDRPYARALIETVKLSVDGRGVQFDIECKSMLSIATEGGIHPNVFKKSESDVPVSKLVLDVLKPYGFTTLETDAAANAYAKSGKRIDGKASPITASALKGKDAQPNPGETAYGFCARIFSRLGVALRTNWNGDLLLSAPDYEQKAIYTILEGAHILGEGDRALALSLSDTNAGQFSVIEVKGKSVEQKRKTSTHPPWFRWVIFPPSEIAPAGNTALAVARELAIENLTRTASEISNLTGVSKTVAVEATHEPTNGAYQCFSQPFKPKYIVNKECRDVKMAQSFAKMYYGKAAETAFVIEATVAGFVAASGATWAVDTICHVKSASLGIDMDLWVSEIDMSMDSAGGQTTRLKLLPRGALIIGDIPES